MKLLEHLKIPHPLFLAPLQDQLEIILYADIVEEEQHGGIVVHIHEAEQDPQFKIGFQFGDAVVAVVGVEVVIAEGDEQGAMGGRENVVGAHGGEFVGDVTDVGEEGVAGSLATRP